MSGDERAAENGTVRVLQREIGQAEHVGLDLVPKAAGGAAADDAHTGQIKIRDCTDAARATPAAKS